MMRETSLFEHRASLVLRAVLCAAIWGAWSLESVADIVVVRGETRPLVGKVTVDQDDQVVVEVQDAEGLTREHHVARERVLLIVLAEDQEKLSGLVPGQWEDYRRMAEELASQRLDPHATELAIRLFLIVAYHERGSVREGAIASLVGLARSPEEERKFRTLAYRSAEQDQVQWLQPPVTQIRAPLSAAERELLLRTVRLIRQDEGDLALGTLRDEEFLATYVKVEHLLAYQDLKRYAYSRSINPRRMSDLLRFELALLDPSGQTELAEARKGTTGWSSIPLELQPPLRDVDWMNATEFDPRDHLYRDGSWRRP